MNTRTEFPVVTIDGPVGSGKGTIARGVARGLGWRLLDSGALYRLLALAAGRKGIALDDAVQALKETGTIRARLDMGGQVVLYGDHGSTEVAIAAPRQRDIAALTLLVDSGSVATSGNSEHGITIEGKDYGHLLDPRTGLPAPDFGSLTVWADNATTADCLSTGLYVLGPVEALRWAERHPGIEVLIIEPEDTGRLRARISSGLTNRVRLLSDNIRLIDSGTTLTSRQ
jgi:thiamine biosynthesis lipoprotein ApbE